MGDKDGLSRQWYKNGQLKGEENFKEGKPSGLFKHWYSNGQLMEEVYWLWGLKEGFINGVPRGFVRGFIMVL